MHKGLDSARKRPVVKLGRYKLIRTHDRLDTLLPAGGEEAATGALGFECLWVRVVLLIHFLLAIFLVPLPDVDVYYLARFQLLGGQIVYIVGITWCEM